LVVYIESVYASLARLQLDYIDLLYFHVPDPFTPVEESLIAIEDLVSRSLIRYFAVSNYMLAQVVAYEAVERYLLPRYRILAVQNRFDVVNGEHADYAGVFHYCMRTGIFFIA